MRRTIRAALAAGAALALPAVALGAETGSDEPRALAAPGLVTVNNSVNNTITNVDNDSLVEIDRMLNLDQGSGNAGGDLERPR
ncbi:hypothetical protein LX15_001009 [Streptoalloteichus tenebrarius]|uniref:Secreted protein n=1 Tax=Streptoalloteichus tenebrarius (strain ATCC 17920 / DSM 40477 / JCM 4838 / CBS 697.72 / NBRC 16177 / NCIMB 11028 / NRRL B-12390 / A12253. 1 / ISP 5477) TaxID=1933 RepID=A0ABT1HP92_STRSD|nr:hypothetical protein [Streptoalloteichus tenebrarius]MCP2257324.1 hypothetical protein [Streptoalloteichus tenebrarius]BFF04233.1 hypothetical protein GCM10020241_59080 [Streptoalloteichus tenebrarius]